MTAPAEPAIDPRPMPHVMNTYGRLPAALSHGKGAWVWDTQGRKYLDGLGGIAVDAFGGELVEHACLADEVQAVVGHRQVFFDDRAVAAPLGIALAKDECVVGQVQQVVHRRHGGCERGVHHMCPTSSGIS